MYYYPGDYSSISSTKGHSILRQRAYGVPHKRPPSDVYIPFSPKIRHHHGEISTDVFLPRHHYYSHAEEDSLNRTVGEELATSSAAMDDSYNMAFKSRDRDHQLMSDLNQAIPPSIYEPVKRRAVWRSTTGTDHLQRYPHSSSSRMTTGKSTPSPTLTSKKWPVAPSAAKYRIPISMTASLDTGYGTDHSYTPTYTKPSYSYTKSIAPLASEHDRDAPSLIMRTWNKLYGHKTPHSPYLSENSQLLHGYISPKWYSSFRSPKILPCTSGIHTPVHAGGYDTPLSLESDDETIEYRPRYSRRRKQLTGGGYYERLLNKRTRKYGHRQPRNWPYYDPESIASSDLSGVISDADSVEEYEQEYPMNRDTLGTSEPFIFDITPQMDDENDGESYLNDYDSIPSTPAEYVPYRPQITFSPIDSVNGSIDYESTLSRLPDLSTVPYIPHTYTGENKSTTADDIMFNSIVAAAAARARNAIQNVDLSDYDQASLVFSVEGEYNRPNLDTPIGFHYISRPLALKGPNLQGYGSYDFSHTDGVFDKYLNDMQDFRTQIRQRLEEGHQALRETMSYIPKYALKSGTDSSYKSHLPDFDYNVSVSPAPISFRKRLEDGYDNKLALYPLRYPERGLPAIHSTEDLDSESRLSTFDKVQIKVSSEAHSSPKAAVASRRATRQQQHVVTPHTHVPRHVPHRRTHKEVVVAHSSVMKPTPYEHVIVLPVHLVAKPRLQVVKKVVLEEDKKRAAAIQSWRSVVIRKPVHVSKVGRPKVHHHVTYVPPKRNFMPKRHIRARQKAALIGHKVDIVLPVRRMPKVYRSVPKLRTHIHVKEDGRLPSSRLHAHVPGHYPPSQAKAIRDVQGFTEPKNIMSWEYRLEARAKPTDMLFHSEHAYESMKDRVLDAQDKLDRHRQLLDRYLTPHLGPETEDVSSQVLNKYTELEARDPLGADGYYIPPSHDAGGHSHHHHHEPHVDVNMIGRPSRQPVSDLRKRIRRVICKSKRDAGYYN